MTWRPALLPTLHKIWIAVATAVLLASCTVVPQPASYTYRQIPCPPGVGPGMTVTAPEAQTAQPPQGRAPTAAPPVAQAPNAPQAPTTPAPQAQSPGAAAICYTAVPSSYTYDYYPGYAYPYPYYPAYYPYPYYGPYYYGPEVGVGVGFGFGHYHHWR